MKHVGVVSDAGSFAKCVEIDLPDVIGLVKKGHLTAIGAHHAPW